MHNLARFLAALRLHAGYAVGSMPQLILGLIFRTLTRPSIMGEALNKRYLPARPEAIAS